MTELNYDELGFKCGVELHQQVDTAEKLFCSCSTDRNEDISSYSQVERFLRPTASELGDVDPAAAFEYVKNNQFTYNLYHETSCLVELDEEPPHPLDTEALNTALTFARLLDCTIPDELHVMRKTVIDGSNTGGFQRTAVVALNGELETEHGTVRIPDIELEEESCGIHERTENTAVYDLNRLGIPLIEVGTAPDIQSPQHAKHVALQLGMLLRSTGNVKRGLGTVRQDVNVSIEEGARVEIKGFQAVDDMDTVIRNEVKRQHRLVQLRDQLNPIDTSDIHTVTTRIQDAAEPVSFLQDAASIQAVAVKEQSGLFTEELFPDHTLGNEIADYARATGVNGIIHTDENLEQYGLDTVIDAIREHIDADEDDLIILVAAEEEQGQAALQQVVERVTQLPRHIPEETRAANDDFTTSYLRPLPGEARMYPETDIPAIPVTAADVKQIDENLPATLQEREEALSEQIGGELAAQLVNTPHLATAEQLMAERDVDAKTVAVFFTQTLPDLQSRENVPVNRLNTEHFTDVFTALENDVIVKDHLPVVAQYLAENPEESVDDAVAAEGLQAVDEDRIRETVQDVIAANQDAVEEQGMHAQGMLMGQIMGRLQGQASGEDVARILEEELKTATEQ